VMIADDTGRILLTLWNEVAEAWSIMEFPVITGFKNCRVNCFSGKSLGNGDAFRYEINPKNSVADQLRDWYEKQEDNVFSSIPFLSQRESAAMDSGPGNLPKLTIAEGSSLVSGKGGKPEFYLTRATITLFKHDPSVTMFYDACPGQNCLRKVMRNDDGTYECIKCGRSYPNCLVRYIANMVLSDATGSLWCSVFDDAAHTILGIDAPQLKEMRLSENPNLEQIFSSVNQVEALFKIKSTEELYNDEMRLKNGVIGAYPLDYVTESLNLLQKIGAFL